MLTGMTLLGLAVAALPQFGFAQSSSSLIGTWKLNLDKSKYSPGPPPRSATVNFAQDGQNIRGTNQTIDAQGNSTTVVSFVEDGKPYPVTGNPNFDARASTRVDAYTMITSFTRAGRLVRIDTDVVSTDGKTLTITTTGTDANGRPFNNVIVADKQ